MADQLAEKVDELRLSTRVACLKWLLMLHGLQVALLILLKAARLPSLLLPVLLAVACGGPLLCILDAERYRQRLVQLLGEYLPEEAHLQLMAAVRYTWFRYQVERPQVEAVEAPDEVVTIAKNATLDLTAQTDIRLAFAVMSLLTTNLLWGFL